MELHIELIGLILVVLAFVHAAFPKYFDWAVDLGPISLIKRRLMYVHTFFIALGVLLMGLLCSAASREIVGTLLGHKIALGMAIFWAFRLAIQFFGYSSDLWRGKKFET